MALETDIFSDPIDNGDNDVPAWLRAASATLVELTPSTVDTYLRRITNTPTAQNNALWGANNVEILMLGGLIYMIAAQK